MTESMFPDLQPVETVETEPVETLSVGRRLTIRQRADVERGIHPLMKTKTDLDEAHTCGSCVHRQPGQYAKCEIGPRTRGPATDVRAWWPGCSRWEARA